MRDYRFSSFNVSRPPQSPMALKMKNDALRQNIRPPLALSTASLPIMTDFLSLFVFKTEIRKSLHPNKGKTNAWHPKI